MTQDQGDLVTGLTQVQRNINYLAKATRYYVDKNRMDEYQSKRYTLGDPFSAGNFLRPEMLADNTFLTDEDTGYDYPEKLLVNAPVGRIDATDDTEVAISLIELIYGDPAYTKLQDTPLV